MISIIVPLYNASSTLDRCIQSILAQRYTDFELLCIDDGSTDDTLRRLCVLASIDPRIRLFAKANGGVSSARNVGLTEARGEFVTFVDSDDWVEQGWLSTYVEGYGGEDLLYQNSVWEMADGSLFNRSVKLDRSCSTIAKILTLYDRHTIGYVWSALFRRKIIESHSIRFDESISYCEDYEFVLRYCLHIEQLNILSPPTRHYHYIFPRGERGYQSIDHRRVAASIMVGRRGVELEQRYGMSTMSINLRTTADILYTMAMAYGWGASRREQLRIVSLVADAPYEMRSRSPKGVAILWLTRLSKRVADRVLTTMYRTKTEQLRQ